MSALIAVLGWTQNLLIKVLSSVPTPSIGAVRKCRRIQSSWNENRNTMHIYGFTIVRS